MDPTVGNEASYCALTVVLYCLRQDVHTLHQQKCCKTLNLRPSLHSEEAFGAAQKYFQTHWSVSVRGFYIVSCQCL